MSPPRTPPRVRYGWNNEGGLWAAARRRWDDAPGRAYVHTESVGSDRNLRIAYLGFPEGERYVLPFLRERQAQAAGAVTVTGLPAIGWRRLRRSVAETRADLLLVGCSSRRAAALPRERSLVLPFRVHLLLDVVPDPQVMLKKVSANERRQFANLRRRHDWGWETGSSVSDLEFFYERMHLPTMASRHGEATRSADWDIGVHCLFRRGHLFFVTEGGKRVAGVLCRSSPDGTLTMRLLGVLDGDETHYRSGAVKAVYYLTVEWAARNGVRRIDMSGGEPFPGRGVHQFKRRFHPTAVLPEDHFGDKRVWLHVVRDGPAVRDLLVATPVLALDDAGRLTGVHFFDAERPALTRIRTTGPGVGGEREIDLDLFLSGARR